MVKLQNPLSPLSACLASYGTVSYFLNILNISKLNTNRTAEIMNFNISSAKNVAPITGQPVQSIGLSRFCYKLLSRGVAVCLSVILSSSSLVLFRK